MSDAAAGTPPAVAGTPPASTPATTSLPKASTAPPLAVNPFASVWGGQATTPPLLTPSPLPAPAAGPTWGQMTISAVVLVLALISFFVGFNMATRASSGF